MSQNLERGTTSFRAMNDFHFNYSEQARSLGVKHHWITQLVYLRVVPAPFIMPPKTSGKAAVKSGKAAKAVTKGDKKKKKGKRKESYAIYIYKVEMVYNLILMLVLTNCCRY